MDKIDMEVYHQKGGTYVVPTEIMNLLLDKNETLTKGIDELIEKYEDKVNYYIEENVIYYSNEIDKLNILIQDLKKLKGE